MNTYEKSGTIIFYRRLNCYPYISIFLNKVTYDQCVHVFQDFWREKIIYRFQNARKRQDNKNEVVVKRKERYRDLKDKRREAVDSLKDQLSDEPEHKKVKVAFSPERPLTLQYGLANYSPKLDPHEDEVTVKSMLKSMSNEMQSKKPNIQKVDLIMNRTFAVRRQYILMEQPDIGDILHQYPVLNRPDEVTF